MRNKTTFGDATTGFPAKWRLRNGCRNSILMTCLYPDLGSASYWLKQNSSRCTTNHSTNQIWVVTSHQYGISAAVSQPSFRGETSGSVANCRLFSKAKNSRKVMVYFTDLSTDSCRFQHSCIFKLSLNFFLVKFTRNHLLIWSNAPLKNNSILNVSRRYTERSHFYRRDSHNLPHKMRFCREQLSQKIS